MISEKNIAASTSGSRAQRGFTMVELMIATVVLLVGIVAVAQLVPISINMNAINRYDSSSLVVAQRQINQLISQPLNVPLFSDPQGVTCFPAGAFCNLGTNGVEGSPVIIDAITNRPVIDFSAAQAPGFSFNYQDPNDPVGVTYDIRWSVITTLNGAGVPTSKRFIVGTLKRGGNGFARAVILDTMVEK